MTDIAPVHEVPPRWVPALLSFVAGYVDSYTFLALFGLFVAQVTGSFVTAGAQFVVHDIGIAGKVIAILAFLLATAGTAALIGFAHDRRLDAMPWMLALETLFLAVFCFLMLAGPPVTGVEDWHGILAGVFGAMAMGTQSVVVRVLMRGIPQTNVMTGNMTQLGVETVTLFCAWRRCARAADNIADTAYRRDFLDVRGRLLVVLSITLGFIFGAACGAAAYATAGLVGAPLAVFLVGALTLWAAYRKRQA